MHRRIFPFLALTAAVAATATGHPALAAHDVVHVENVHAERQIVGRAYNTRDVLLLRPTTPATAPPPALILLPYLNGQPVDMAQITDAASLVRDHGVWVIVPQAANGRWDIGTLLTAGKLADDIGFLSDLIDILVQTYGVDARRITMAGYSNGGYMAERYACEHPEKIAGIGLVGATLYKTVRNKCAPALPVPVVLVNGDEDGNVAGDTTLETPQATADFWSAGNGCAQTPLRSDLPDTVDDDTRVYLDHYPCAQGEVASYIVRGGGHTWPGALDFTPALGRTSQDIRGIDVLWQFLSRQSR